MRKKSTIEYYIERAKEVHGDKYDYSKVEYVNAKTKIIIICKEHGEFLQNPNNHLRNRGCSNCGGSEKLTKEKFIKRANEIHNNKYDYSEVYYVNNYTKVCIICPEHGIFFQNSNNHLNEKGCLKCSGKFPLNNIIIDNILIEQNRNIKRVDEYINVKIKISWECLIESCQNVWKATPNSILNSKSGCPRCTKHEKLTNEIVDSRLIEQNRKIRRVGYVNGCDNKIEWKCLIKSCNNVWLARPYNIFSGYGCPKCSSSKGELEVERVLKKLNLNYKTQVKFPNCKNIRQLSYDFGVYDSNNKLIYLIEVDGEQHSKPIKGFRNKKFTLKESLENFEKVKKNDNIKTNYSKFIDVPLIRIPYYEFKNIEEILIKELKIN